MTEKTPTYPLLMATLGGALASWSNVENNMGLLFTAASGIDFNKAGAIYDAIVAFEARLAVLDATMENESSCTAEEKELWACLSARLRKLYKKRHEVAHFSLIGPDVTHATTIAPFFTWNKHNRNTVRSLSIAQIAERSGKFTHAANAMSWFVNLVQTRKFPEAFRPPLLAEPVLIVRIRELIALKKQAPTPPPQPSEA